MRIALAAGRSWRADGARVRSALHEALEHPDAWEADGSADERSPDERLAGIVQEVLDGKVGDFIRSHGGRPSISSVKNGVVAIGLRGACSGCPAAGFTLTARIEGAIRERFPELRGVTAE
ncbi:MAG TPA: NifU family protein [Cryobacterium sp.]|nr:NifU family protein [Cryobacterium sp.]